MSKKFKLEDLEIIETVRLDKIRNRNEVRVAALLPEVLLEFPDFELDPIDVQDIYALTLNNLPARYAQAGSIVLRESVTEELIKEKIRQAVAAVRKRPNY